MKYIDRVSNLFGVAVQSQLHQHNRTGRVLFSIRIFWKQRLRSLPFSSTHFLVLHSIKNFSWDRTNGPRSGSCDRAIRYSGFFRGPFFRNGPTVGDFLDTYCWWTKSCTTKDDDYPIIYRVLTIPGGAGFRPSTVTTTPFFFLKNDKDIPHLRSSVVGICFRSPPESRITIYFGSEELRRRAWEPQTNGLEGKVSGFLLRKPPRCCGCRILLLCDVIKVCEVRWWFLAIF